MEEKKIDTKFGISYSETTRELFSYLHKKFGLKQYDISQAIEISPPTLSRARIESSHLTNKTRLQIIKKTCYYFNVKIRYRGRKLSFVGGKYESLQVKKNPKASENKITKKAISILISKNEITEAT